MKITFDMSDFLQILPVNLPLKYSSVKSRYLHAEHTFPARTDCVKSVQLQGSKGGEISHCHRFKDLLAK